MKIYSQSCVIFVKCFNLDYIGSICASPSQDHSNRNASGIGLGGIVLSRHGIICIIEHFVFKRENITKNVKPLTIVIKASFDLMIAFLGN